MCTGKKIVKYKYINSNIADREVPRVAERFSGVHYSEMCHGLNLSSEYHRTPSFSHG